MNSGQLLCYIAVMAGVTYLIRMLPLVLIRKKLSNRFLQSLLYYIPYAVLAAMTFPAILYSTGNLKSGIFGLLAALVAAFFERSLLTVAVTGCLAVAVANFLLTLF